jgi:long-chain acyl-CoA synthetase
MLVSDIPRKHATRTPDKTAIVWEDRRITYAELQSRTWRLANALQGLGVRAGDRVGLLCSNRLEHVETVFAIMSLGAVWVPLNDRLTADELGFIVDDAECTTMMYSDNLAGVAEEMHDALTGVERWIGIGTGGGTGSNNGSAVGLIYDDILAEGAAKPPAADVSPDDMCAIMYTSGTTGRPKGAMHTHRCMMHGIQLLALDSGAHGDEVSVQVMPQFHAGGHELAMTQFLVGSTTVVQSRFDPDHFHRLVADERVNFAALVPSMMIFLLESPSAGKTDVSSLSRLSYGASPIPEDRLARAMEVYDADFQQTYGQTEAGVMVTLLSVEAHRKGLSAEHGYLLKSCGQALLGCEIKLADDDGNEVALGEIGEIWARKESVMSGYWNRPEATEKSLRDGWLRTGDMGRCDSDGYYYVVDRKVDKVISGGENIYPVEVENIISSHPGVLEVAVIGVPDERWVEAVKAVVASRPGASLTEAEVIEFCRGKLGGFKVPKSVDFIEALPRTPSGKVRKAVLREPYWEGHERKIG